MNEPLSLASALVMGVLLGAIFLGGLWWTVRQGLSSKRVALWFLGSLLLRMGIVLAGFYLVSGGQWEQLLLCLLGFVMARLVVTWGLMFVLVAGSILVTRNLSTGLRRSRWQNLLEIVVSAIKEQIAEVGLHQPEKYLGFLGTLFLFVAIASVFTIVPGYQPPTGSLSTTVALAICVFVAVPLFGIEDRGLGGYLRVYLKPTFIMLPFNIISELSRTLALAVRLFGNMMSGTMILAILLTITPFIFPIAMSALGLLTGMVQAYMFSILATVYIAAATRARKPEPGLEPED